MIRPEEFPYIQSLHVNDCYTYQDFDIVLHDYQPFSHLILTGKNGSGKSTILKFINNHVLSWRQGENPLGTIERMQGLIAKRIVSHGKNDPDVVRWQEIINQYDKLTPAYTLEPATLWAHNKAVFVYSFLEAKRASKLAPVSTVTKESDFTEKLINSDSAQAFISQFKQYLVNQKINQAFSQLRGDKAKIDQIETFFSDLARTFQAVFEDTGLELLFIEESFEFYIQLSDGRKLTFDTLSEGFSALLSILMDLFMRVDLIRKQVGDFSYHPCGIVLIDEPETHLHLELQYQVLPLLTSLFPNIQFIAATHSPAVVSSIRKATIFDLSTKVTETDELAGRSFSELMVTHFGLENEYSTIADQIIAQVNDALRELRGDKVKLRQRLEEILVENGQYLSPTLKVELESMILQNA